MFIYVKLEIKNIYRYNYFEIFLNIKNILLKTNFYISVHKILLQSPETSGWNHQTHSVRFRKSSGKNAQKFTCSNLTFKDSNKIQNTILVRKRAIPKIYMWFFQDNQSIRCKNKIRLTSKTNKFHFLKPDIFCMRSNVYCAKIFIGN